jgi:hypothetical protein
MAQVLPVRPAPTARPAGLAQYSGRYRISRESEGASTPYCRDGGTLDPRWQAVPPIGTIAAYAVTSAAPR